jgi:3-hydroxy acid dehydrogenase / malonic semialdehyde reductase
MSAVPKKVLITGASSGIGEACARRCARDGHDLVLWARRADRLAALAGRLRDEHAVRVRMDAVDVRDRALVSAVATAVCDEHGVPDVLINNAGLASGFDALQDGDPDDWDRMIDTNIKGLLNVTHALLPRMIEAGRGHVVNIGSTASHMVYPKGNVYNATKYAVRALSEGMNLDVAGTPIRVSSVDPGFVETEFSAVRFEGDTDRARKVYEGFKPLSADDVAEAIHWVTSLAPHVNVQDLVITPTAQRNVYVVDREDG